MANHRYRSCLALAAVSGMISLGGVQGTKTMVIRISPELEAALTEQSQRQGISADRLAIDALRQRFLAPAIVDESHEEWAKRLRSAASDCGGSLSHAAVGSDGLYE